MKKLAAAFIIGILCLSMFGIFLPSTKADSPISVQNAVVNQYQTSLQLPAGSNMYLYCMDSGGAYASQFLYGEYAYATTYDGNIGASIALTTSNQNSYSYSGSYYSIGGIGISGFSNYYATYAANNQPGASSVSVQFSLTSNALVVFIALASSQQYLTLSGIPNLIVDAASGNGGGISVVIIAHAYLGSGSYTASESSAATSAGQDPNHMVDLLGVFEFTSGSSPPPSNTNLLANPGFENGLSGWSTSQGNAVYSVDSSTSHSGSYSAKGVETNTGSLGRLYQDVTGLTSPGNQYQISGWIKTSNVVGSVVIALDYVGSGGWTPGDGYVKEIGYVTGTQGWAFFQSSVFTLPPKPADAQAAWFLFDFNAGTGTAWWDDVSLVCVTPNFDFAVSSPSSPFTVAEGGSINVPVQVNLVSGTPQQVSLSVAWIPTGSNQWFTTSFSQASGNPPFTSTLSITASSNAPPGTYTAQIIGVGGGNVHSALATIAVGEKVLFSDDFNYAQTNGYLTSGKWLNEQWPESDYSQVSSANSNLVMNVPKDDTLRNKVHSQGPGFNGKALDVFVRFKIVNPQPDPNYAIFLFRQSGSDVTTRQELDWEFSAAGGPSEQQITCYYHNAPSSFYGGQKPPFLPPWDKITSYSDWTTLEFKLEPDQVTVCMNGQTVAGPFQVRPKGGFDATDFQLYFETSENIKDYGRAPLYLPSTANQDSAFLVDSVQVSTDNYLIEQIHSPANLLVTDPQNRLVGFNPSTGEVINQIPYASYSGPGTEPQTVIIPDPIDGAYETTILGTASGNYLLTIEYDTATQATTQAFSGTISQQETLGFSAPISGSSILTPSCAITFGQLGIGSDFGGTILTVDGTSYNAATLPITFYWEVGSVHTFAFQSPLIVTSNGEQYVWTSTSGLSSTQSGSITVTTSGNIQGNYKTQYYLTLTTLPSGVTVPKTAGWYDAGSSPAISTTQYLSRGGIQYVFDHWSGDISGTASPTNILMNAPKTVTANYLILPLSALTSESLSPLPNNNFNLLFIQDMQNPNTYVLTASNPGQFCYNIFCIGTPGALVPLTINIPAPFVTQGAMPIHVYSGVSYSGSNFVPSGATAAYSNAITGTAGGTISLTITVPSTGLAYVTVHLDFGYKGTTGFALAPDGTYNAYLSGKITIPNNNLFTFSDSNGGKATVLNANNFKKVSGFGGVVTNSYGDPAIGVTVTVNVGGATLKATTDSNGFYMITYKTGKAQTYTVAVTGYNTQTGTIKANGFAVNNFKP